ncbi:DUF2169 domain-containing protein [Sorangium cellulosum]
MAAGQLIGWARSARRRAPRQGRDRSASMQRERAYAAACSSPRDAALHSGTRALSRPPSPATARHRPAFPAGFPTRVPARRRLAHGGLSAPRIALASGGRAVVLPWTVRSARWPVAMTSLGRASAATLVWGLRGQRYVTAVVKATFGLVAEGAMALGEPDPIVPGEVPDPSGVGLRSAGDLAPYLREVDVLLTGHAGVPPTVAGEIQVRLAVVQEGALRLDRCVTLDGSAGSALGSEGQRRVRVDGMGPLSRRWPRREALLGAADPRRLEGVALEVPDGLDWGYFQAAPPEQRMERLLGDEWVVLGGIVAQRPRLRTQLPGARGVARLYRREERAPREGAALSLRADTLQIDADRRCCSVVCEGTRPWARRISRRSGRSRDRPGTARPPGGSPSAPPLPRAAARRPPPGGSHGSPPRPPLGRR